MSLPVLWVLFLALIHFSHGVSELRDGVHFKEVTRRKETNTVVVFYSPWSGEDTIVSTRGFLMSLDRAAGHWKRFAPQFDAVAKGFAGVQKR